MNHRYQQADACRERNGRSSSLAALAFNAHTSPAPRTQEIDCQDEERSAYQPAFHQDLHVAVFRMRKSNAMRILQIKRIDMRVAADPCSEDREIAKRLQVGLPKPESLVGQIIDRLIAFQHGGASVERVLPGNRTH